MTVQRSYEGLIISKFHQRKWTLAVAESCTGGLLSHLLTNVDGASLVFLGGVVAYSPQAKIKLCNAKEATIDISGTVSPQITEEICVGIQEQLRTTVAVAITGVAGDSVEDKPKGLVYICISSPKGKDVKEFHFEGSRFKIKERAVLAALDLLLQL